MKRILLYAVIYIFICANVFSQRILFQSDLETIPLVFPDSLPAGWAKLDVDQNNPAADWGVRDTNQYMGSGDTSIFKTRAHSGKKSIFISWLAGLGGNNLNNDWLWTDSLMIQTGDSLLFWMLIGATPLIAPQYDSVQVYITSEQTPASVVTKLATIKSNDSAGIPKNNNTWTLHKFDLSTYNGQKIYIAWRYYIVINTNTALWVNLDDIFIGNRTFNSIKQISSEIPQEFVLKQNYPNPFNPNTLIDFSIPQAGMVTTKIYSTLGQEVCTVLNEYKTAGTYRVNFNSEGLSSGIYYYRITVNMPNGKSYSGIKKMTLVK